MATTVQSFVGGGTDLTELTSGEKFLIGILGQKIRGEHAGDTYSGGNYYCPLELPYNGILDMSNVNSITITLYTTREGSPSLKVFGREMGYYNSGTVTFNPSNGNIQLKYRSVDSPSYCEFTITSFTTKDGKVHTASNLNY